MKKQFKKIVVTSAAFLMLINGSTVFADEIDVKQVSTSLRSVEIKESYDTLYVVTKEDYKKSIEKDFAIIQNDSNLLVIQEDKPTKQEMEIIKASEKFYLIGEYKENLEHLLKEENYHGNMFGFNRYESAAVIAEENGTDKDIIIANGESLVDSITASQIGILENKNVILIDHQTSVPQSTREYLKKFGKDKQITFLEGEFTISPEIMKEILTLAGNNKYELNKLGLLKKDVLTKENDEINYKEVLDKISENKETEKAITENIVSKLTDTNSKDKAIAPVAHQVAEELKTILTQEDKVIKLIQKDEIQTAVETVVENVEPTKNNLIDFLNTENESLTILKNKEIEEKLPELLGTVEEGKNSYLIKVTYAQPFEEEAKPELETIVIVKPVVKPDINKFINQALTMKGWTYSQDDRWAYGYADCSSIVIRSMIDAGITQNTENMTTRSIHRDNRFKEIPFKSIVKGDILWKDGHMEIYMGGNTTFGAFDYGVPAGYGSNIHKFTKAYRITGK